MTKLTEMAIGVQISDISISKEEILQENKKVQNVTVEVA